MKVARIVSDGSREGTKIYSDTGEEIKNVTGATWWITASSGTRANLMLMLRDVPVDVVADETTVGEA